MPLQATSGAASYDAFGGGVAAVPQYIEDVFSTWLYPSVSGDNQIIINIDLSTEGGLVWIKRREGAGNHYLIDTARGSSVGNTKSLSSNTTTAQTSGPYLDWLQFNNDGFTAKAVVGGGELGTNTYYGNMSSWTFRKQPKFFDVVTYTAGSGPTSAISHNLGVVPGCIIMKSTSNAESWLVVHRGTNGYLFLNLTDARDGVSLAGIGANTSVAWVGATSTTIDFSNFWGTGSSYVAYLFAHDAGGFGLTGTDNVISCGSVTANASAEVTVNLGWEPQFIIYKPINAVGDWYVVDNMRGWTTNTTEQLLRPNSSAAESGGGNTRPLATGFGINPGSSNTYIYIAIRRGPMKVPTDGTKVFSPIASSGSAGTTLTTNFPVDMQMMRVRDGTYFNGTNVVDRLRGVSSTTTQFGNRLLTAYTDAEDSTYLPSRNWNNSGFELPSPWGGSPDIFWNFRRAPGFFDEVCYTGTGTAGTTVAHNLTVAPTLLIFKIRSASGQWLVASSDAGFGNYLTLNTTDAAQGGSLMNNTAPTASVFSLSGAASGVNASGSTYVAYLFATCPGVSKVGSYTGTGTTQQINCGFAAGSRFVLIKRTDSTGDWYVWDSARGIVAGNDPYLLLNSAVAEVTSTDYVDTYSAGFEISSTAPAAINASGGSFIFLAIA
jgi:hypothetical protein